MAGDAPTPGDPELARVHELLQRQLEGNATEAEREELVLYASDRPELRTQIEAEAARGGLGQGWLERVRKDDAMAKVEGSQRARLERGAGVVLVLAGWALSAASASVGGPMAALGIMLLLYSLIRVRLSTHASDPYKDIVR